MDEDNVDNHVYFVNLNRMFKQQEIIVQVPKNEDIMVIGDDLKIAPTYEWQITKTDCDKTQITE